MLTVYDKTQGGITPCSFLLMKQEGHLFQCLPITPQRLSAEGLFCFVQDLSQLDVKIRHPALNLRNNMENQIYGQTMTSSYRWEALTRSEYARSHRTEQVKATEGLSGTGALTDRPEIMATDEDV
jgi:hypothetical protein